MPPYCETSTGRSSPCSQTIKGRKCHSDGEGGGDIKERERKRERVGRKFKVCDRHASDHLRQSTGWTIPHHLHKGNEKRADDTVLYLHSLRLVHGFDCILCHCPCRKRDKRTACGNKGTGGRKDKKKTTRQKDWTLVKPTQSTRTATRRHCSL